MAEHTYTKSRSRQYVAAVVLGTALSALGVPPQAVAGQMAEPGGRVVADISRYCSACWRNARLPDDCWGDCTQEVFSRLMQRVQVHAWDRVFRPEGFERQEFVRAIDAVKKRTQRRLKRTRLLIDENVVDRRGLPEASRRDDREVVARASAEVLSPRQQRILQLSFEGWAVNEIAGELGTAPERVSDEKYKAIRKLREHLNVA